MNPNNYWKRNFTMVGDMVGAMVGNIRPVCVCVIVYHTDWLCRGLHLLYTWWPPPLLVWSNPKHYHRLLLLSVPWLHRTVSYTTMSHMSCYCSSRILYTQQFLTFFSNRNRKYLRICCRLYILIYLYLSECNAFISETMCSDYAVCICIRN